MKSDTNNMNNSEFVSACIKPESKASLIFYVNNKITTGSYCANDYWKLIDKTQATSH